MRDKYTNPKEAICLFLYSDPQKIGRLQEKMYPDNKTRNTRVSGWIKELIKGRWLKEVPNIKDRRVRYYQTTSKFFYDYIINKLKKEDVKLNSEEKKRLKELLKSEVFKNFVLFSCKEIDFKNDSELSDIMDIFAYECVFTSWKLRYEYPRIQSCEKANIKIDFQRFMDELTIHPHRWRGNPLDILDGVMIRTLGFPVNKPNTKERDLNKDMDSFLILIEKLTRLNARISNFLYAYFENVSNVCEKYHYLENNILSKPDKIKGKPSKKSNGFRI